MRVFRFNRMVHRSALLVTKLQIFGIWKFDYQHFFYCICVPNPNPGRACERVASDLGIGGVFQRVLQFLPPLTIRLRHRLA